MMHQITGVWKYLWKEKCKQDNHHWKMCNKIALKICSQICKKLEPLLEKTQSSQNKCLIVTL